MAYLQGSFPVARRRQLAEGFWDLWVCCPPVAQQAQAGQFVNLKAEGFFLRRPISICEIRPQEGLIRLVFQVRGEGTEKLSQLQEGDRVDLLGPLGNGFKLLSPQSRVVLVGGGIGVPPLLQVAAHYGPAATVILGFRTAGAAILTQEFRQLGCDLRLVSDDGTLGRQGLVTGPLEQRLLEGPAELVCACGPMAMLREVVSLAEGAQVPSQVSLEEHMACGVGACLVCACRTVKDGREIFSHVCKDGPVFDGKEVVFQ